jgi:3-oxoacyl-[acyl-carrier-protein] synthase-3
MINAAITGVNAYVPEDIITNADIEKLVDTSDEWILSHVGIRERRVLKGIDKGTSVMGAKAVEGLLQKTGTAPEEVEALIFATTTADYGFPSTSSLTCEANNIHNAMAFDLGAACSGFLFALETGSNFIKSGKYKKVIVVGGDKMTSITNYADRNTCPLFGDAAGAVLLEPVEEDYGIVDVILHTDGAGSKQPLHMFGGGSAFPASHETVDRCMHYVYQEGQTVFKHAVSKMADVSAEIVERNALTKDDIAWFIPHQANLRIIDAAAKRMGLEHEKVIINIDRYGNTSAGTIPVCLWENEHKFKKGDNIVLSAFGAGYTWGAILVRWAY